MKTKHKISAIAFVVAASLSLGALAGQTKPPKPTPVEPREGVSSASVSDAQIIWQQRR